MGCGCSAEQSTEDTRNCDSKSFASMKADAVPPLFSLGVGDKNVGAMKGFAQAKSVLAGFAAMDEKHMKTISLTAAADTGDGGVWAAVPPSVVLLCANQLLSIDRHSVTEVPYFTQPALHMATDENTVRTVLYRGFIDRPAILAADNSDECAGVTNLLKCIEAVTSGAVSAMLEAVMEGEDTASTNKSCFSAAAEEPPSLRGKMEAVLAQMDETYFDAAADGGVGGVWASAGFVDKENDKEKNTAKRAKQNSRLPKTPHGKLQRAVHNGLRVIYIALGGSSALVASMCDLGVAALPSITKMFGFLDRALFVPRRPGGQGSAPRSPVTQRSTGRSSVYASRPLCVDADDAMAISQGVASACRWLGFLPAAPTTANSAASANASNAAGSTAGTGSNVGAGSSSGDQVRPLSLATYSIFTVETFFGQLPHFAMSSDAKHTALRCEWAVFHRPPADGAAPDVVTLAAPSKPFPVTPTNSQRSSNTAMKKYDEPVVESRNQGSVSLHDAVRCLVDAGLVPATLDAFGGGHIAPVFKTASLDYAFDAANADGTSTGWGRSLILEAEAEGSAVELNSSRLASAPSGTYTDSAGLLTPKMSGQLSGRTPGNPTMAALPGEGNANYDLYRLRAARHVALSQFVRRASRLLMSSDGPSLQLRTVFQTMTLHTTATSVQLKMVCPVVNARRTQHQWRQIVDAGDTVELGGQPYFVIWSGAVADSTEDLADDGGLVTMCPVDESADELTVVLQQISAAADEPDLTKSGQDQLPGAGDEDDDEGRPHLTVNELSPRDGETQVLDDVLVRKSAIPCFVRDELNNDIPIFINGSLPELQEAAAMGNSSWTNFGASYSVANRSTAALDASTSNNPDRVRSATHTPIGGDLKEGGRSTQAADWGNNSDRSNDPRTSLETINGLLQRFYFMGWMLGQAAGCGHKLGVPLPLLVFRVLKSYRPSVAVSAASPLGYSSLTDMPVTRSTGHLCHFTPTVADFIELSPTEHQRQVDEIHLMSRAAFDEALEEYALPSHTTREAYIHEILVDSNVLRPMHRMYFDAMFVGVFDSGIAASPMWQNATPRELQAICCESAPTRDKVDYGPGI
jgi:hypothetical protein